MLPIWLDSRQIFVGNGDLQLAGILYNGFMAFIRYFFNYLAFSTRIIISFCHLSVPTYDYPDLRDYNSQGYQI